MSLQTAQRGHSDNYRCTTIKPAKHVPSLLEDIRSGLLELPRSLPPKYFYDEYGSDLFDRICDTKEYYPTRLETALLKSYAYDVMQLAKPAHIVELGSGTSRKTRNLFDACGKLDLQPTYWPMDVCEPLLIETARALMKDYSWLNVNALVGDYHGGLQNFPKLQDSVLYVFLGGTIGNFEHQQAVELLTELSQLMRTGDYLLMGFDRTKDREILEAAYNDAEGITADFNLNLLNVLNRDMDANFDVENFSHQAVYNTNSNQIEMYLVAAEDQLVDIEGIEKDLHIKAGERILTEISRKFSEPALRDLLADSSLQMVEHYAEQKNHYSLVLVESI